LAEFIGGINDWNGASHKMEKDKFGVWPTKIDHVKNLVSLIITRLNFAFYMVVYGLIVFLHGFVM
jgi:1,4-alpha-glucan branching enzyme